MFGALNPKKMQAMMKQMGIAQNEIDASRVIIEKEDGNIIIENPSVVRINMSGNVSFQISGDVKEEEINSEAETPSESEEEKLKEDIRTIAEQTGVSEDIAAIELEKNNSDIAETIIKLKKK